MGVKRLKIKNELHYRPGRTAHYCSQCNHWAGEIPEFAALGNDSHGKGPRCRMIGIEPGIGYRINPKYICDKYDNSIQLKRLRGY